MKKTSFLVLSILLVASLPCFALDYTITFTGTGASTTIESVIVQNLTKGTTVTVPAGNVLNLNDGPNAVEQLNANDEFIRIYPNLVEGKSTVSFFAKQAGSTQLNAFSIDGRKIAGITEKLQTGVNSFQLSLPKGSFVIQVVGNGYTYTAKMINQTGTVRKPEIAYSGTVKPATSAPQKSKSFALGTTTMTYTTGDQLLYKGISGNYCTIVTDKPEANKTTNFDFIECVDADGNYYSVVKIGTQTWMVENLKTTKYKDGTTIPLVTDNTAWTALSTPAYCWYNNDATTYKNTYGALYNWYAVNTAKLAPTGWHVPTDTEWTTLTTYLGGESVAGGKLKEAGTGNWLSPNSGATNATGFSALPGGTRSYDGTFYFVGSYGYWWSSTEFDSTYAWNRAMGYSGSGVDRGGYTESGGFSVRCVKGDIPVLSTTTASTITSTSAISGGNVTSDGGVTITSRGVCWSTSPSPTIALSTKTTETGTTGSFTSLITGLSANTIYYIRAYATNDTGTGYGNQDSIKTFAVMDIDGNGYHSVTIGTQTWLVENLKTTKYRNGESITNLTVDADWAGAMGYNGTTAAWCDYSNLAANGTKYGHLYNWYAASDTRNIAPVGWHVPTDAEWTMLTTYLGGESVAGGKLKEAGTLNWLSPNTGATNETGFSALPGGYRDTNGTFYYVGTYGYCWSSSVYNATTAWDRLLLNTTSYVTRFTNDKTSGFSVRCIIGDILTITTTAASAITSTTATSGGNVTADGGATVTARGVCWNTSGNPTITDSKTSDGSGTGSFTSNLTNLISGTTYYIRAYATNSVGTGYGNQDSIKTFAVMDIDGNGYHSVTIGTQTWMVENLKTTKYRTGESITNLTVDADWVGATFAAWCDYSNIAANGTKYGHLYNWYAASDIRNIAPVGWHVPTDAEWTTLSTYLGGLSVAGGKLKEAGTLNWASPNTAATNETGFSALPGGHRYDDGMFVGVGYYGFWWSSSEYDATYAWYRYMSYSGSSVYGGSSGYVVGKADGFSVRCLIGDIPVLSTTTASTITSTSAISGGNVTADGNATVTTRGVCWNTSGNPTITDSKTSDGSGTGSFTSNLTNLTSGTTYYIRAYATNSVGTGYGNEVSFKTFDVMDIDGNGYHSVTIGTQTWMVENLKTTKYRTGEAIPNVTDNTAWGGLTTGAWCDYDNLAANGTKYGHLYNWYAASDARNIAPVGWHVPTDAEWTTLTTYLGGESVAGGKLKEAGTLNWASPNSGATNETGFSALPGGGRSYVGPFGSVSTNGGWWSSAEYDAGNAWYRDVVYGSSYVLRNNYYKQSGFSVRCVRDY